MKYAEINGIMDIIETGTKEEIVALKMGVSKKNYIIDRLLDLRKGKRLKELISMGVITVDNLIYNILEANKIIRKLQEWN